jgi:DNA-directed RNA polymerase specialized sigma24 family protein
MPERSDPTDEEFVRRMRAGDGAAAGVLFDRHAASLRACVGARREERIATDADVAAPEQPSPIGEAAAAEESASIRAAVAELPSDYAAIVRLIHQEDLTLVEAGRRMGRSADAVRKLYGRALACLVDRVGGRESADG